MSKRHQRRVLEDTNISFLDIICCGFGAIVLLLVIVKPAQIPVLEESPNVEQGQVRALQKRLFEIRGQVKYLETELNAKQQQLGEDQRRVAILRGQFDKLNNQLANAGAADNQAKQAADLKVALQSLTREMKRLLANQKSKNDYIAGVPVDSEYIIFIIDTSGSMFTQAWQRMISEVSNTLKIYPKVKGIQVLNDNGQYMFPTYAGQWIPDTSSRRRAILERLQGWRASSNSSPVEGITRAIRRFYDPNKKISLYVIGDDYSGRSVKRVVDVVKLINQKNANGETLVRIHGIGFPVNFGSGATMNSQVLRYASLMRNLAEQNNGTFIGVNSVR